MKSIRGKVAIVGAAETEVGKVPHLSPTELCADAAFRALEDAGISCDQVDGLVTCNSMAEPHMYHAEAIAEYMQIFPRYCVTVNVKFIFIIVYFNVAGDDTHIIPLS